LLENLAGETISQYSKRGLSFIMPHGTSCSVLPGIAWGLIFELGRKKQENHHRKVTGEIEARICAIACSAPPDGRSRWTIQAIADELIRLEVVEYITDSTVCEFMKKTRLNRGSSRNGAFQKPVQNL
jgi:hypothetical protein